MTRQAVESIVLKFPGGSKDAARNDAKNTVSVVFAPRGVARRQPGRSGRRGLCKPLLALFFKRFDRIGAQWPVMMGEAEDNGGCCFEVGAGLVERDVRAGGRPG